jgi:threonine dehydratase
MQVTLEMIKASRERIKGAIYHSPCPYSLSLSQLCGAEIFCKLDHLQMTGSFKERGARNKLLQLSPDREGCELPRVWRRSDHAWGFI